MRATTRAPAGAPKGRRPNQPVNKMPGSRREPCNAASLRCRRRSAGARGAAGRLNAYASAMPPLTISGIDELRELIGKPIGPVGLGRGDPGATSTSSPRSRRDDQWIHVDVERAERESPFGTTVAHGNLTLSLIDGFRVRADPPGGRQDRGSTTAGTRSASRRPVPAGAKVRATAEVAVGRGARRRLVPRGDQVHARARGRREARLRRRVGRPRAARVARAGQPPSLLDRERALHAGLAVAVDRAEERVGRRPRASTPALDRVAADRRRCWADLVAVRVLDHDVVPESRPGCRTRSSSLPAGGAELARS